MYQQGLALTLSLILTEGDVDARASCIPSHVHHILFEVLKNALRATALSHADLKDCLPPVRVRIAQVRNLCAAFSICGA